MSVPAFRNSKSKVRRRRSHHALKPVQIVIDKVTGEPRLPHHKPASFSKKIKVEKKKPVAKKVATEKNEEAAAPEKSGKKTKK